MLIEERVEKLEKENELIKEKLNNMSSLSIRINEFLTVKELANIMKCSTTNIRNKINSGEIKTVKNIGSIIRIPMYQFYTLENESKLKDKKRTDNQKSMKELIFRDLK